MGGRNKVLSDNIPAPAASSTYTYNEGLMRTASSSLGPNATFSYHHNLQLADTTFGNGLLGANIRGTNGMVRPARRVVGVDEDNILWDSGAYSYDEAGNIKSIGTDSYTYDAANRLRSATVKQAGENRTESYQYNTTDSMTQVTNDQFGTRTFNVSTATNRLLGIGSTTDDWTYTGAGNTLTALGGAFQFNWDAVNMLTRYREGSNDFVSVYGPGDYRVWVEDQTTGKIYWTSRGANGKILREFEVTGNGGTWKHIRDFLYGAEGVVASVDHDGTEIYFHTDHLGTPRLKTNASGGPFSFHHYYPYGLDAEDFGLIFDDGFESGDTLPWEKDTDVLSVKFTGHERERYKNLDYMLGRHYIFLVNRFASVDPARDGWNLYSYAANSPVGFKDPTGRYAGASNEELAAAHEAMNPEQQEQFSKAQVTTLAVTGGVALAFTPGPEDAVLAAAGTKFATRILARVGSSLRKLFRGSKSVDEVLDGARAGRVTMGRSKLFEKDGGFEAANRDFNDLKLDNVREIQVEGGTGRVGELADGRRVIVRSTSKGSDSPTLEIQDGRKRTKVRYQNDAN